MTKSKTDKHLRRYTVLQKKINKSPKDKHLDKNTPLKGVGNGKIDVFKELTPHSRTF